MATPAHANLLTNGSFEDPVVPSTGDENRRFTNFLAGSTAITGWTVVGVDAAVTSTAFKQDGISFEAQSGQQWIDLAGVTSNNRNSGVTQSISTISGSTYRVSFYVGSATDDFFFFASTVDLSIDGGPRISFTNPTAPTDSLDWLLETYDFVATGSSTSITFLNGDAPRAPGDVVSNNFLTGLDNASVELLDTPPPPVGGVPEPHEVALIGAGLLAMRLRRRRPVRS